MSETSEGIKTTEFGHGAVSTMGFDGVTALAASSNPLIVHRIHADHCIQFNIPSGNPAMHRVLREIKEGNGVEGPCSKDAGHVILTKTIHGCKVTEFEHSGEVSTMGLGGVNLV
jgi:hypothetical protein